MYFFYGIRNKDPAIIMFHEYLINTILLKLPCKFRFENVVVAFLYR
jgi:hypothetical protein